ncbi:MAG: rRNA adenine N(6)-methyltransferase family protein [Actinomycetota bacterium]
MSGRQRRRPPASPPSPPNAAGAHFLRDRSLITALVRSSGAGPGSLVLDLGAGYGAITTALAQAGARVVAVERDPRLAGRLHRRFGENPDVSVVEADLRVIPLPRRDFLVVANPPFSATTALLRRLLGDRDVPLAGADLIVQWGAAKWLASPRPRDAETARWMARYEMRLVRRIPAASFAPAPSVDAAHLSIRPRAVTSNRPRAVTRTPRGA